jgi:two-component system OmpR family response regulator
LLRRGQEGAAAARLSDSGVVVDLLTRTAERDAKPLQLTAREFDVLVFLMRHARQVVTRKMLLEQVWDLHFDPQTNVIDVHMSRLRQALDRGFTRALIHTIRGTGYMFGE